MTLKIERIMTDAVPGIRLMGRLTVGELESLTSQIRLCGAKWVDLEEVALLDLESVEFLIACEAGGAIELRQCSAYIREWMTRAAKFGKERITSNQTRRSIGKEASKLQSACRETNP